MKIWNPSELEETGRFPDEFEGIVENYEWDQTDYGERLVLYINPTSYDGPMRRWRYKYSTKKNSIWGHFIDALMKAGITIGSEDDLVGKKILWKMVDIEFTNGSAAEPIVARMLSPMKLIEDLGAAPQPSHDWDDKEIKTALANIRGKTTIDDLMTNLGMPKTIKKRVIAVAAAMNADGVISFDPEKMEISQ